MTVANTAVSTPNWDLVSIAEERVLNTLFEMYRRNRNDVEMVDEKLTHLLDYNPNLYVYISKFLHPDFETKILTNTTYYTPMSHSDPAEYVYSDLETYYGVFAGLETTEIDNVWLRVMRWSPVWPKISELQFYTEATLKSPELLFEWRWKLTGAYFREEYLYG